MLNILQEWMSSVRTSSLYALTESKIVSLVSCSDIYFPECVLARCVKPCLVINRRTIERIVSECSVASALLISAKYRFDSSTRSHTVTGFLSSRSLCQYDLRCCSNWGRFSVGPGENLFFRRSLGASGIATPVSWSNRLLSRLHLQIALDDLTT